MCVPAVGLLRAKRLDVESVCAGNAYCDFVLFLCHQNTIILSNLSFPMFLAY